MYKKKTAINQLNIKESITKFLHKKKRENKDFPFNNVYELPIKIFEFAKINIKFQKEH